MTDERIKASYVFAARKGLIKSPDPALRHEEYLDGRSGYGIAGKCSREAFILRDLARLKLGYMMQKDCHGDAEARAFFEANRDLFTRYEGDSFRFEEVKDVIGKMIRELEWEEGVDEILSELA